METTNIMKEFLKDLCDSFCWDYAVFWKPRHQNPAILSWGDGYCSQPKSRTPIENSPDMLYFDESNDISLFNDETGLICGSASQYPIELLMADMSSLQHTLGEGLVGRVAGTPNYYWISSEEISASLVEHDRRMEFPEEWLPQLLAGIKTMLLVSLHPDGVLQLGSSEKVAEDAAVVDHIKKRFLLHQVLSGFDRPTTSEEDGPLRSSPFLDNMDEPSSFINAKVSELLSSFSPELNFETNESNTLIFSSLEEIIEDLEENKYQINSETGLSGILAPLKEPLEWSQSEIMHSIEQFYIRCHETDLPEISERVEDSYINSNITTETYGDMEEGAEYTRCGNLSICSIPIDSDLSEALDLFQSQSTESPRYESQAFQDCMEPSGQGECKTMVKNEDLLEAVIANIHDGLNGSSPSSPETLQQSESPLVQCDPSDSSKPLNKTEEYSIGGVDDSVLQNYREATFAMGNRNSYSMYSNPSSSNSTVSCLTDKKQPRDVQEHQLSGNKRKGRPGDSQRPRPRDRQLIQDRVKELRELVPSSSKCSIDGLLDRTVKHMHFLRSVTNQAEKLRKCVPLKGSKPKLWESLGINGEDCDKSGKAFDFGCDFQVFPIVVEDLEHSGHMLIEMMCHDPCLFLEIAQVLRRLELTILEGLTETRSDTTWARFVVEKSKGYHRMEIFWPLMQVLQQSGKTISGTV
ncbi:hypothetical protein SAY86_028634 [Trapa natans]|uniref:BHLH domain-containing protein n=1 Tax=Trapa natans TaxID=22666 RepID=A0AAN7RGK9_TRANT|nr:hypothetical protein SAY86_028634 [Trapa natans]